MQFTMFSMMPVIAVMERWAPAKPFGGYQQQFGIAMKLKSSEKAAAALEEPSSQDLPAFRLARQASKASKQGIRRATHKLGRCRDLTGALSG